MIIVSQDKTKIVNFDNIAHIFISKDSEKHFLFLIEYGKMTGTSELLGVYSTEERAKEVLQEIMKKYLEIKCFYYSKYEVMQAIEQPKVFEMPVEKVDDK